MSGEKSEVSEGQGFVKTIKMAIKEEVTGVSTKIDTLTNDMKELKLQMAEI